MYCCFYWFFVVYSFIRFVFCFIPEIAQAHTKLPPQSKQVQPPTEAKRMYVKAVYTWRLLVLFVLLVLLVLLVLNTIVLLLGAT